MTSLGLTLIWLLPVVGGITVAMLPPRFAKWLAVLVTTVTLLMALLVVYAFNPVNHHYQLLEQAPWIPQLKANYLLGVDYISVWLVVLNAFIGLVAVLATPATAEYRTGRFLGLLLVMEGGMAGVFLSLDLILFYVFWEAMLIPAYFLLWQWGEGDRPLFASLKFVLFTLAGSLLMLVGIIGAYAFTGAKSFDLPDLAAKPAGPEVQFGLFFLFAIAFAIKVPVFPFHGWLRDAYVTAPTPMLLAFAGVMGKTGAYAMLRILLPLFPHPVLWWDWNQVMPVLAVIGIVWGALMALSQRDMKAFVAYSSLSHMGFIVLGIFSLSTFGRQGAVIQMVNHGLIVPALFLLVAWLAERTGSRDRSVIFGLAPRMPVMAGVFLVVTLAALGLPGLNSFVGEFMVLLGAWSYSPWLAVVACIGLVLAPVYMLRLFQGAMYASPAGGELAHGHAAHGAEMHLGEGHTGEGEAVAASGIDIRASQLALLAPLIALMFVIGLDPALLTRVMNG